MTRREAREAVFCLLFETEFRADESFEQIFDSSREYREVPDDAYIREVYFGVTDKRAEIDEKIEQHAKGWKISRMSRVSRNILRIAVYEMMYMQESIPALVSINEAVELTKKFDADKARGFINGILHAIKESKSVSKDASSTETETNA